ncbi:hypothetical protein N0V85_006142 [Neurospora sp. IMI 360204]|nr:hypothetical protein N0V85_006142 [Neurospora sp. IMI 360204]
MEDDFEAAGDRPPPNYTENDISSFAIFRYCHWRSGPPPPGYTAATRTDPASVVAETPTSFEPYPIDGLLGVQLLMQLLRCIRTITEYHNGDRYSPDDFVQIANMLEKNFNTVTVPENARTGEFDLAESIKKCIPWIRQYGMLLKDAQRASCTSEEAEQINKDLNRLRNDLLAVHTVMWDKVNCDNLCSRHKAWDLLWRNYDHWIETVDEAMFRLLYWHHPVKYTEEPRDSILTDCVDKEKRETLFRIMARPTLAKIRTKVLQSLQLSKPCSRRFESVSYPRSGTFEGILNFPVGGLEGQSLRAWLKSLSQDEYRLCWITGDPGSGKSVLMKHLVSLFRTEPLLLLDLEAWEQCEFFDDNARHDRNSLYDSLDYTEFMRPHVLSHFFDNGGSTVRGESTQSMMLDLLRQIFEQDPTTIDSVCHAAVTDESSYQTLSRPSVEWDFDETEHLLHMALEDCRYRRKPAFILLDMDRPSGFEPDDFVKFTRFIERYTRDDHVRNNYFNIKILLAAGKEGVFSEWNWPVTIRVEPSPV